MRWDEIVIEQTSYDPSKIILNERPTINAKIFSCQDRRTQTPARLKSSFHEVKIIIDERFDSGGNSLVIN